MHRKLQTFLLIILACALVDVAAFAITSTVTATIASTITSTKAAASDLDALRLMALAFKQGDWALGSGLLLTFVVASLRVVGLLHLIPKKYDKYVAAGIAVLTSIALGLQTGEDWWKIVTTGATIGLIAIGGWETVGNWIRAAIAKAKGAT